MLKDRRQHILYLWSRFFNANLVRHPNGKRLIDYKKEIEKITDYGSLYRDFPFLFSGYLRKRNAYLKAQLRAQSRAFMQNRERVITHRRRYIIKGLRCAARKSFHTHCDTRHARKRLYNLQRPPGAIGFSSTRHLWLDAISHSDMIWASRIYLDVANPQSDCGVTQATYGPLHRYETWILPSLYLRIL